MRCPRPGNGQLFPNFANSNRRAINNTPTFIIWVSFNPPSLSLSTFRPGSVEFLSHASHTPSPSFERPPGGNARDRMLSGVFFERKRLYPPKLVIAVPVFVSVEQLDDLCAISISLTCSTEEWCLFEMTQALAGDLLSIAALLRM